MSVDIREIADTVEEYCTEIRRIGGEYPDWIGHLADDLRDGFAELDSLQLKVAELEKEQSPLRSKAEFYDTFVDFMRELCEAKRVENEMPHVAAALKDKLL